MKTKPRRSRKYINHGAMPTREYKSGIEYPAVEQLSFQKEEDGFKEKSVAEHTPPKLPVKIRLMQQFRQNRAVGQKPCVTSLAWRTSRTSRRNTGSDNRR